ncbi:MAG TPA: protein-L-isoaspartate O-methyltransferase [Bradyrhizobium sp.]|nr:protein-L-isoaspartate O-methyltransferase [Bradyrhizobium sp.]
MSGFTIARQKMVDGQVRPSDVTDIRIIDAMLAVPREAFVPPLQRAMAYLDIDLDVSAGLSKTGLSEKRYLIKPVVTAKMLQAAEIRDTDNVLVVGCATGYSAAIVARLAAQVTATERDAALAGKAQDVLALVGYPNVTVRAAAAAEGDAANAPYDVIMLNGATEVTPVGLYRQLKDGGRLVGVFAMMQPQRATLVTHSHGDFGTRALFDAAVPVLPGLGRLPAFIF